MNDETITTSLESVRRLFVTKQHLAFELPKQVSREHVLSVVRDLCYVQWDPIDAVAPSHVISLWSRLGSFKRSDLEGLLWDDRKLFMHWNPATLVPTEYYPMCYSLMKRYPVHLRLMGRMEEGGAEVSSFTWGAAEEGIG